MPLHDWSELAGWEGVHLLWMTELLRAIKGNLPAEFRAYLGTGPAVAIGAPPSRPDVSVRRHDAGPTMRASDAIVRAPSSGAEPDIEVAVAALESEPALMVERDGRLIAALELISPRNKDRSVARTTYGQRYAGYLMEGVHLLLVDVHPRPANFSFADQIAHELNIPDQPSLAPPMAVSYRVGEPAATGGRLLAIWRHPLRPGELLPTVKLSLDVTLSIPVDLEGTYTRAAADAYLS